jgi:tripartite-type tricarboxylate transporter receptor subunit TctC
LAVVPVILAVRPDSPYRNVQELIEKAKLQPGTITYTSPGVGSLPHLIGEQFKQAEKISLAHVPLSGPTSAVLDVASARVDLAFLPAPVAVSLIARKQLKALAITSEKPSPDLPDIPPFSKLGVRGVDGQYWYGVFAPRADKRLINMMSNDIRAVLKDKGVVANLQIPGMEIQTSEPEQFESFVHKETLKWSSVTRSAFIRK